MKIEKSNLSENKNNDNVLEVLHPYMIFKKDSINGFIEITDFFINENLAKDIVKENLPSNENIILCL